ncbi:MAG TPA: hypothetical protein VF782_01775 [Allosphingosinicella sp.]|jgi:hypothetical protein
MDRVFTALAAACLLAVAPGQAAPRRGADAPEQPSDLNEKVICKTFTRIGTLASRYRTCKTKAEWERERINLRQANVSDSCGTRGQIGGSVSPIPGNGNTFDC